MSVPRSTDRRRRRIYLLAVAAAVAVLAVLLVPGRERLRAAGPANTGHEALACTQCHTPADGTVRQQLQANARYLAGLRGSGADFVHKPVGNVDCVSCHTNEDDKHAPHRFNEPRFEQARAELAPQYCVSCHSEHQGGRVTVEGTFCGSCHQDMEIREDPITPSHASLASEKKWGTCLSCHDYHGNHIRTTPTRLEGGIEEAAVRAYLRGGSAIYGNQLRFPARKQRELP